MGFVMLVLAISICSLYFDGVYSCMVWVVVGCFDLAVVD